MRFEVGDLIVSNDNKVGIIKRIFEGVGTYRIFWIKEKYYNHYYDNYLRKKIGNNQITKVLYE